MDVNKEAILGQKWDESGAVGDLHLEEVVCLEKHFVDLFVLVDDTSLLFWEVKLPVDEHCICVRDR